MYFDHSSVLKWNEITVLGLLYEKQSFSTQDETKSLYWLIWVFLHFLHRCEKKLNFMETDRPPMSATDTTPGDPKNQIDTSTCVASAY